MHLTNWLPVSDLATPTLRVLCFCVAVKECVVATYRYDYFTGAVMELFHNVKFPKGETIVIEENQFIEGFMPSAITRTLTEEEMNEYRRSYLEGGESRRPMLTWNRQAVFDEFASPYLIEWFDSIATTLQSSNVPMLFINVEAGFAINDRLRAFCRTSKNQKEITVKGIHFMKLVKRFESGSTKYALNRLSSGDINTYLKEPE